MPLQPHPFAPPPHQLTTRHQFRLGKDGAGQIPTDLEALCHRPAGPGVDQGDPLGAAAPRRNLCGGVSEMRFDLVTQASPEQVLEAMTDFTDRRLEIWKTLDPKIYEVRERGDTWAVAREGSPHSPYWVIVHYDWSDPQVIRWTELQTNHGDPGDGFMRIEPHDAGGSHVHVEWSTHPIRTRDKLAITLIHHTMNHVIARMWRKELDRFALA